MPSSTSRRATATPERAVTLTAVLLLLLLAFGIVGPAHRCGMAVVSLRTGPPGCCGGDSSASGRVERRNVERHHMAALYLTAEVHTVRLGQAPADCE